MNRNRYRLVFNETLGMMVPVSETARRSGKSASGKSVSGSALALAGALLTGPVWAQALPVPCAGGACGVNPNPTAFVTSGAASWNQTGNLGVVTQTTNRAILNWQSFNIGSGNTVQFVQPNAGSAALNRIWQGDASVIAGALKANGQVYLVNQNGIVFANGAQTDTGGLVASTLPITDKIFNDGIPSNTDAGGVAAFAAENGALGGLVRVEAGAELKTTTGGRVMLLAENVENHGLIETPEGQTILAAGSKVYLAVSDDNNLRGFLVEVDNGGTAANTGRVIAERGNISMTGLTVNQSGRLTATTSVNLNGTIRLMARDSVSPQLKGSDASVTVPVATRTGDLVFGANSTTEVLPEIASTKGLSDEQIFNPSKIEGVGRTIHAQNGSTIRAQGGTIDLEARAGQSFQTAGSERVDGVRIQVDDGAVLDASGLKDVSVGVERNYIEVELRGSQLADSPLQRNTFLNKSKVWVDIEKGTPLADVSADIAKVERTVAEKSAVGGTISLRSEGDLVLQQGATLDVSGGSIAYRAGFGRTTTLIQNGKRVNIGEADPEQIYNGFADRYVIRDPKWNTTKTINLEQTDFINAYTVGRDAGKVGLTAHRMAVDATLRGGVQAGPTQRENAPAAGTLAVTLLAGSSLPVAALPDLRFVTAVLGAPLLGLNDTAPNEVNLSTDFLSNGGFGSVKVSSKGRVIVPLDVNLDAGTKGTVDLTGRRIDVDGDIRAAGGTIRLATSVSQDKETADPADFAINIGSDATLDVAGLWSNDLPGSAAANSGAVVLDGGTIQLAAHSDLNLAAGSVLDASAGAQVTNKGKLRYGDAGTIGLASGSFGQLNAADPLSSRIQMGGELRAYGFGEGGTLKLKTASIRMGDVAGGGVGELLLGESFFGLGGFDAYELTGVDGVTVTDGYTLQPRPVSVALRTDFRIKPSSTHLSDVVESVVLPPELRAPSRVTLVAENFFRGDVTVGEGAVVRVDPEGAVELVAGRQLTVLGTLDAPAGHISLKQTELQDGEKAVENFDPGRAIFLGERSKLLATGFYRAEPNNQGLRKGTVLDGGMVEIEAAKGYLIAQQGSKIDVSGTATTLDLVGNGGLAATQVASDGGTVRLAAREGMLLEGDLAAHAGGTQARGGSLDVKIDRLGPDWVVIDPANPLRTVLASQRRVVFQDAPTAVTAGLSPGAALDTNMLNGELRFAARTVAAGGFDNLSVAAEDRIVFENDLSLNLPGRLALYAPNFSTTTAAQVNLNAASVAIGNPGNNTQGETSRSDASSGAGSFVANAGLIDLVGHTSLQGFGRTALTSQGDIRTQGVVYDADLGPSNEDVEYVYRGSLTTGGDLALSARQVYPVSMAEFSLEIHNNPSGRITVTSTGTDTPVLSAGGKLTLAAPFVEQRGTLKAPFGEIALRSENITRVTNEIGLDGLPTGINPVTLTRSRATNGEVTLASGSITSVSAEGQLIPFGATELSGKDWIYDFGLFKKVLSGPPEKQIVLEGDRVIQQADAKVDLSGGGDLFAYEFLKGPGGSKDFLLPENNEGLYAILPGSGAFAAYDPQSYRDLQNQDPGASVQVLQSTQGLAAGNYALLPARYALLPGAYLVRVLAENTDQIPGVAATLPNGATRVAGYFASATATGDVRHGTRTATLEIRPGSIARQYSEYLISQASTAFANQAGVQQTGDAGRLSIAVGSALSLQGDLLTAFGAGKRGAEVDISADKLAVTSTGSSYAPDYVTLGVDQLDGLGASSLLLGGSRRADGERTTLEQRSDAVVIANDANHVLASPELILVARDTVKLEDGAVVAGEGTFSGTAKALHVTDASGNADGALLRVSSSAPVDLSRAPVNQSGGVLDVAAGATVRAGQSAILDATLDNRTLGQVELPQNGGALTLGAARIALAENGVVVNPGGLVFDQNRLAALGNLAHLVLRSYSTVDLYGDVTLGGAGLESLRIEAAGIGGFGAPGTTARLAADVIAFANPDGIDAATAFAGTTGTGDLDVQAETVELGAGDFTLRGFERTRLSATGEVKGLGGHFAVEAGGGAAGHLDIEAGRITTAAGVDQTIWADGDFRTASTGAAPTTAAALGGRLDLIGASVTHGGRIDLPAGIVTLHATHGDVALLDGSAILAGGRAVDFADTQAFAPGGTVQLVAEQGQVTTGTNSLVDVAGSALGGDAGELTVWAEGDANLAGTMRGNASSGYESGRFTVESDHIGNGANDFSALNAALETGGFHGSRTVHVRTGDIDIAVADVVRANEVRVSADQGDIRVAGKVDASAAKGGRIGLYAGHDLTLEGSAQLIARSNDNLSAAKGTSGEGGQVELASGDAGTLNLAAGSLIDVSTPTGSAARAGRVTLRAARTGAGAGTGVALGARKGRIVGAETVDVEAFKIYDGVTELASGTSSGSTLGLVSVQTDNDNFVGAVDVVALKDALDTGTASFRLRPGVDVRNTGVAGVAGSGDIRLASDWNLNPLRHAGEAGVLTVRAGGSLLIDANLSDGFSTATSTGLLQSSPVGWSVRLVSGADTAAADPLATRREAGNAVLKLAAGKLVRTGVGDLDVASAGDMVLESGAALYSAGYATPAVADFTLTGLSGNAFPTGGGDVSVRAGGGVVSETGPSGLITDWLYRQGNTSGTSVQFRDPGWWPQIAQFSNGVAALGGGDVAVTAGGRVANLLAATVTNARQPATFNQPVDSSLKVVQGGGDLKVRAGGDIEGGLFHVDRGTAVLRSGGSLREGLARATEAVGTVLSLGDASADAIARTAVRLDAVINPTLVPQVSGNLAGAGGSNRESYFVSYSDASAAHLLAVAGNNELRNDFSDLTGLARAYALNSGLTAGLGFYPGTLEAVALQGNVLLGDGFTLMPSALGDLRLLAGTSIEKQGVNPINLSDLSPSRLPVFAQPVRSIASIGALTSLPEKESDAHGPELLHLNDPNPAYVVAKAGDIVGQPSPQVFAVLAKSAVFQAGRDILDVTVVGQNMRTDNATRFVAGRDITFATVRDPIIGTIASGSEARIAIGGPGRLELIAGRHIDLGASQGVLTRGNLANPNLPEGGADLLSVAGAAAHDKGGNTLPIDLARFGAVNLDAFFMELGESAKESSVNKDYSRGETAIAALFPTGTVDAPLTYDGDISLFFSQLKTEQGGDIRMLTPGGGVNAGLASVTGFSREAADLGIMTVQGGDIQAYTLNDFEVNSSRVFTISGGDILLWSAKGDIDAGKGAKTASATPPPQLRIDKNGNFVLDVSQSISGSGIGGLGGDSDVVLVAPSGEVNAGDAGIRAGGNLTIAAQQVVGADNIQVGGVTAGVPISNDGAAAAAATGAGNIGADANSATASLSQNLAESVRAAEELKNAFKPTFISAEVIGYGE